MKLQQLIEGQKEQIAGLRKQSPVSLFHPTDVEGAVTIVNNRDAAQRQYTVMPALKHAVNFGDVVIHFYGQGKDLEPPRMGGADSRMADRAYPDSYDPRISFALLQQRPRAIYTGHLSPNNIEHIYVMQQGKPEPMGIERFLEYAVQMRGDQQRQKSGLKW